MPHRHEALLGPSLSFCPRRMGTRHLQDPKTLLAPTSPAGLRTLFFLAFTLEVSTWAWSKERPLTLGSGRFCSLSSSVKGVGRGAQCPGEHRGGHASRPLSAALSRTGKGLGMVPFSSPSPGHSVPYQATPLQKTTSLNSYTTHLLKTYLEGISS